jgi:hypothetical protein
VILRIPGCSLSVHQPSTVTRIGREATSARCDIRPFQHLAKPPSGELGAGEHPQRFVLRRWVEDVSYREGLRLRIGGGPDCLGCPCEIVVRASQLHVGRRAAWRPARCGKSLIGCARVRSRNW